eukprot:106574-Chlamydomonas_euryale.AAC.1
MAAEGHTWQYERSVRVCMKAPPRRHLWAHFGPWRCHASQAQAWCASWFHPTVSHHAPPLHYAPTLTMPRSLPGDSSGASHCRGELE